LVLLLEGVSFELSGVWRSGAMMGGLDHVGSFAWWFCVAMALVESASSGENAWFVGVAELLNGGFEGMCELFA
jgi:hypothetical protein